MAPSTSTSRRSPWAVVGSVVASLALVGTAAASASANTASVASATPITTQAVSTADGDSNINGFRNVGYFAQWGVYGRDFKLKQLQDSGAAADLTHLNYAFGNIHHEELTCFIANKAQGTGPNGSDGAGDAWADFGMGYTAANSVAGVADQWDQPLAGNFNQIKQLKEENPNLKAMLSIGGWTWSKNFSKAAATDASREKLVSSCIDIYIKGNLPTIDGKGGDGAAAGVFDGIDIDWEWPGTNAGLEGNYVDEENDQENFRLLLAEFRKQLDEYGAETGENYLLSAFLPASPTVIEAGGWNDPRNFESLDFGNVQGYDLHGAWNASLTGHQINLYDDPADPRDEDQQFSVDKAVNMYIDAGVAPEQLGLGMAMYGRGWKGVDDADPWAAATGAGPGTWEAGNEDYTKLKNLGTSYFDPEVVASWRYDGNQWWTLDDDKTIPVKADYIRDQGLGGGMWWELDGDRNGELTEILMNDLGNGARGPVDGGPVVTPTPTPTETSTPDPTVTPTTSPEPTVTPTEPPVEECANPWSASEGYPGGTQVTHNGETWENKWWSQGEEPGASQWGPWVSQGSCDGTEPTPTATPEPTDTPTTEPTTEPTVDPGQCLTEWVSGDVYVGGDEVSHNGHNYRAKWWTNGDTPGAAQWGPWEDLGAC
ncbi:glycosyl hydrolase family 18 protein [Demequina flava]|uniref:glycosyl hydrolase family 18 protein n=1 Tax=Demequina flava TaxID=1095025 RepID=UPI0007829A24|nr:glycosyl hydrolase family 18 protein [Demequina flava]